MELFVAALLLAPAAPQETPPDSPWGIAPSHSASWGIGSWAPAIAETGIRWMRGFYQAEPDRVLPIAEKNGYRMAGILAWSKKGKKFSFPVDDLPEWRQYVKDTITKCKGRVRYWEVWNEPPNFSESKNPADYGKIVVAAYQAAKEADPSVQIGLAAQSVNLNFLAQALDAGATGHFDYVTVHPYEVMDLVHHGWEGQFLSIVPTIRKLLADKSPKQKDCRVWFTEIGQPVEKDITPDRQADTVVKAFTLGLAQGVHRIHWFEGIDGDSGPFGLIAGNKGGAPRRPSFTAMTQLIKHLGHAPKAAGWLQADGKHPGFLFDGAEGPVLAVWAAPGSTGKLAFGRKARVVKPKTGEVVEADGVDLTPSPIFVLGAPFPEARANLGKPYLWGGDYSGAKSVRWDGTAGAQGLHPTGTAKIVDGARDVTGSAGMAFTVDPGFLSYTPTAVKITVVLKKTGDQSAGFNVKYESTSGAKGGLGWYNVPAGAEWVTQSWTLKDTQFVGKFGFHFSFDGDSPQHGHYLLKSVVVEKE
jgi:hypothetical protein